MARTLSAPSVPSLLLPYWQAYTHTYSSPQTSGFVITTGQPVSPGYPTGFRRRYRRFCNTVAELSVTKYSGVSGAAARRNWINTTSTALFNGDFSSPCLLKLEPTSRTCREYVPDEVLPQPDPPPPYYDPSNLPTYTKTWTHSGSYPLSSADGSPGNYYPGHSGSNHGGYFRDNWRVMVSDRYSFGHIQSSFRRGWFFLSFSGSIDWQSDRHINRACITIAHSFGTNRFNTHPDFDNWAMNHGSPYSRQLGNNVPPPSSNFFLSVPVSYHTWSPYRFVRHVSTTDSYFRNQYSSVPTLGKFNAGSRVVFVRDRIVPSVYMVRY